MTDQDEIYALMDRYNGAIEPLESWETADISKLISLLDAELQRRYDESEHFLKTLYAAMPPEEEDYFDIS